jgi:hypothetical protein
MAQALDPLAKDAPQDERILSLGFLLSRLYYHMPTVNLAYDDDPKFSEASRNAFLHLYPRAISRIDTLVEEAAKNAFSKQDGN